MFENIIGHRPLVAALRSELRADRFPRASLIHGPAYSGKCSLALEVARVLSCEQTGEWGCSCQHCRQQRDLTYPFLLLLGWRYFDTDIRAAAATLRRVHSAGARYLFARAARRLTRRYDPVLWEGDENKLRLTAPLVAEINELVEELLPVAGASRSTDAGPMAMEANAGSVEPGVDAADGATLVTAAVADRVAVTNAGADAGQVAGTVDQVAVVDSAEAVAKRCERVVELAAKLQAALKTENIPISQLRNVEAWLHLSTDQGRKVVIIEQAEGMGESSRNALLRLLEEPPADVHVMLLARRAESLNATLRSRLREYAVAERTSAEEQQVLGKIFRGTAEDAGSLRVFFLGFHDPPPDQLRAAAMRFIANVSSDARGRSSAPSGPRYARAAGLPEPLSREAFNVLLEELSELLRPGSDNPIAGLEANRWRVAQEWALQIDHAQATVALLRQQPGHVLQRLGAAMAAAWRGSSAARLALERDQAATA